MKRKIRNKSANQEGFFEEWNEATSLVLEAGFDLNKGKGFKHPNGCTCSPTRDRKDGNICYDVTLPSGRLLDKVAPEDLKGLMEAFNGN